MRNEVVAIRKEHTAVHANVVATIHLVVAIGRGTHDALLLAIWPLGAMDQLMIEKVLLSGEALAAGGADHPPLLLEARRSRSGGVIGVTTQVAPEGPEAGIVVAADRALVDFSIVYILVVGPHSLAPTLGVLPLAAAFFQAVGASCRQRRGTRAVVVHATHKAIGQSALLLLLLATTRTQVRLDARHVPVHLPAVRTDVPVGLTVGRAALGK